MGLAAVFQRRPARMAGPGPLRFQMAAGLPTKRLRIDPDMYTFPESPQRAAPGCEMGFWRRGKGRAPAQYGEIAAPPIQALMRMQINNQAPP